MIVARTPFEADTRFRLNFIRLLREQGLNQSSFAKKFGKSQPFVSDILRGRSVAGLELIDRIAQTLNVDVSAFFQPVQEPEESLVA